MRGERVPALPAPGSGTSACWWNVTPTSDGSRGTARVKTAWFPAPIRSVLKSGPTRSVHPGMPNGPSANGRARSAGDVSLNPVIRNAMFAGRSNSRTCNMLPMRVSPGGSAGTL
jgi:hypothetical protein